MLRVGARRAVRNIVLLCLALMTATQPVTAETRPFGIYKRSGPTSKSTWSTTSLSSKKEVRIRRPFENVAATLAWGYDTRTGEFKMPCLKFDPKSDVRTAPVTGGGGEFSKQSFEVVDSYESIINELNLDFSASMRYFVSQASAGVSVANKIQMNRYSSNAFLHLYLEKSARFLERAVAANDQIKRLAKDKARFRDRCGDSFVYAVVEGGEMSASVAASGSSNSEQRSIKSRFQAGVLSFNMKGSVDDFFAQTSSVKQMKVTSWAAGGQAEYLSSDELQKRAKAFFQSARANPIAIEFRTLGYENVADLLDVGYESDPTTIGYCALQLNQYVSGLQYINENKDAFHSLSPGMVKAEWEKATAALAEVKKQYEKNTVNWSGKCPNVPDLPDRTDVMEVPVTTCGWNSVAFLPATDAGWSMLRMGGWCAWTNTAASCDKNGYFMAGQNDTFRCTEGNRILKVQESNIAGPCHVESAIGDNICGDNVYQPNNHFRAEFSENLSVFDKDAYVRQLKAMPSDRDRK